jgi:hypothetical protein
MNLPISVDADARLYEMVHTLLQQTETLASPDNRRDNERQDYKAVQLVALCRDGQLPAQADFFHVECHDIAPQGFSFFMNDAPDYPELVVALGRVPFSFFKAQIMHREEVLVDDRSAFLIGCRFTSRIEAQG